MFAKIAIRAMGVLLLSLPLGCHATCHKYCERNYGPQTVQPPPGYAPAPGYAAQPAGYALPAGYAPAAYGAPAYCAPPPAAPRPGRHPRSGRGQRAVAFYPEGLAGCHGLGLLKDKGSGSPEPEQER